MHGPAERPACTAPAAFCLDLLPIPFNYKNISIAYQETFQRPGTLQNHNREDTDRSNLEEHSFIRRSQSSTFANFLANITASKNWPKRQFAAPLPKDGAPLYLEQ